MYYMIKNNYKFYLLVNYLNLKKYFLLIFEFLIEIFIFIKRIFKKKLKSIFFSVIIIKKNHINYWLFSIFLFYKKVLYAPIYIT